MKALKLLPFLMLIFHFSNGQVTYFEDFLNAGEPAGPGGSYWYFVNDLYPAQSAWNEFVPGDGYAYATINEITSDDANNNNPYQFIAFGSVPPGHRIEMKMKGAIVDGGFVGFLFVYNQNNSNSTFNEIDIELVADDIDYSPVHSTLTGSGWSDCRLNSWRDADLNTSLPYTSLAKAIDDGFGNKVSHIDDQFHTYTIDWRPNRIDFFIDDVFQDSIHTNIATGDSELLIGFRDLSWAGEPNWSGIRQMVIDWANIEPIHGEPSARFISDKTLVPQGATVSFYDQSIGATSWSWSFPGGTPSTSNDKNPQVIYNTIGTYNASLQATNSSGSKSSVKMDYITVSTSLGLTTASAKEKNGIQIIPNPSHGSFMIPLPSNEMIQTVHLINPQGKNVPFDYHMQGNQLHVNSLSVEGGVFTLLIQGLEKMYHAKLILVK